MEFALGPAAAAVGPVISVAAAKSSFAGAAPCESETRTSLSHGSELYALRKYVSPARTGAVTRTVSLHS